MSSLTPTKPVTNIYLLSLSLAAGILITMTFTIPTLSSFPDWILVLLMSSAIVLLNHYVIFLPPNGNGLSMDSAIYLASIFVFGVEYSLMLLLVNSMVTLIQRRTMEMWKHLFNFSIFTITIITSYFVYILTGGELGQLNLVHLHSYVLALICYLFLNVLFIAFYFWFNSSDRSFTIIRNILKESVSNYVIILASSLSLVTLLVTHPIFNIILFTFIIILISNALREYHLLYEEVSIDKAFREQIMNSIPVGIATYDFRKQKYTLNTTAKQILEIESDQLKEKINKKNTNREFWDIFSSKYNIHNKKLHFNTVQNHYQLLVSRADLLDQYDTAVGKIYSFIDITEIEQLEKRIYQSEKLALLGEISAKAAHEIRNPLTVIYGFLTLMKQSLSDSDKNRFQVPLMLLEFERINSIIDEMLSIAKPKEPSLVEGYVEDILKDVLALYKQSSSQNINIDVDLHPIKLLLDKRQMTQVLYNMIRNSAEAIGFAGTISIFSKVTVDTYQIFIKDDGSGIPLELQKTIFEPFLTSKDSGTGLGLTIVQRIIENHGGSIKLFESSETGTTFIVSLPLQIKT
ncbi:two-component system sensor histidine kinase NtrB [Bacillus suaedaesalsae]|uniref:histidine kinase n=1 Tax=Bacillus suaedaesalsae TaxID=2810349 RepID=A0ABS2DL75_9BACI|nr:ATP-binding protein [Bacillus suaedaesalsae]MBM6619152.1 sensor histidine kinase [Bacillus suaedaesalsae]